MGGATMPEIKKILDEIKEDAKTWSDDLIAQLNPDLTPEQIAKWIHSMFLLRAQCRRLLITKT